MNTYMITPENRIGLYGYNTYTKRQIEWLLGWGCNQVYVIDRNATQIEKMKGVTFVTDLEELDCIDEMCVWIMLQNAMQHTEIAWKLYARGVRKILFVPMIKDMGNKDLQMKMIMFYNWMLFGKYEELVNIPVIEREEYLTLNEQLCTPIIEGKEDVIAWIPALVLRTSQTAQAGYGDVPMVAFIPYHNLIRYLKGEDVNIDEYMENFTVCGNEHITEQKKCSILMNRKQLVDYMDNEFNKGAEFFVAAAPQAKWNTKGFFNLCEGHHRCTFLLDKKWQKIPVRISTEDMKKANEYFISYRLDEIEYQYVARVQMYFGKRSISKKKIWCSEEISPTVRKLCGVKQVLDTNEKNCIADIYMDLDGLIRGKDASVLAWIEQCCRHRIQEVLVLDDERRIWRMLHGKSMLDTGEILGGVLKDGKRLEICAYRIKNS